MNRPPQRRVQTYTHRNRQVRIPEGYLAVGMVVGAHGLRGELKVELHTDFPERFAPGVLLWMGEQLVQVEIETVRPHQGAVLMQFTTVRGRTAAEALRGQWLFIPNDQAEKLDEDTFFVHDIIGTSVQTVDGRLLGTVQEVVFTGANDVYVLSTPDDPPREILIPAVGHVIQKVDLEQGIITVELPAGLLDE
jgi:16S rRNA processing protein RimM